MKNSSSRMNSENIQPPVKNRGQIEMLHPVTQRIKVNQSFRIFFLSVIINQDNGEVVLANTVIGLNS